MKIILANIFLFLFSFSLLAQANGSIKGTIIDSENGEAVFGATIVVRSEKKFAKTDFDGKYSLDLPPGEYEVEYQMYGYGPQKKKVTITSGKPQTINVTFGAQTLETVEVVDRAKNNTESALLALQRKSGTVSDGISQEAIKKSPDSSAGDVVRRVTGITLIGGKYVFVRGLGERYSNTTVNDIFVPTTEPDKRVVPLDIFPSSMLKNIRVMKTFSPEDPAEFSGGLVKIETQEYPDQFQMNLGVGLSYNKISTNREFKSFDAGDFFGRPTANEQLPSLVGGLPSYVVFEPGNRFGGLPPNLVNIGALTFNQQWTPTSDQAGYDKSFNFNVGNTFKITDSGQRLGVFVGFQRAVEYRTKTEKQVRYIPGFVGSVPLPDATFLSPIQEQNATIYNKEVNSAANANFAYEITKGQQVYFKNLYSVNSDTNVRDTNFGVNRIDNFQFIAQTNTFTSRQIFNSVLGGDHAIQLGSMARPHKLEWQFGYSVANRDEPNLTQQVWRRSEPPSAVNTPFVRLGGNPDGSRFFSESQDTVRQTGLKYEIPFEQWNGLKSSLKIGTLNIDRFKDFRFREFNQRSQIGVSASRVSDLWPVPGELTFIPTDYLPNRNNNDLANKVFFERQVEPNAYDAMQKLRANFIQFDLPLVNKFRFVGGVRYEDSYQKVKTFVLKDQVSIRNLDYGCRVDNEDQRLALVNSRICDANNNGIGELAKKDLLPSANFVWEFHKDMNLRFGLTQTVTRPDLRELSPFGFTPYFGADRIFGNPNLKRTYIHNYDVRWEYYITQNDYVGVGVFQKNLSSPIEMVGFPVAGSISNRFSYTNAEQATLRGVELDFRKEFLERFRVETNFFFIKSRVDVIDWVTLQAIRGGFIDRNSVVALFNPTNTSRPLQGQSEFVYNVKFDTFLTKKRNQTIGVYYNYFGDRIYSVGANGTPDAYERGVGLTDIVYSYTQDERLDFKLAAKNIFDTRFRVYQRDEVTNEEKLFMAYRIGYTISASMTYKLF
ncbi:TonB-dependent receptor [Leptospira ryugenii]|uniref:TonB-dependent receptor n=1 Tax=Leptospira ryugenii TaxID=1917863 RepID=A0A2P2E3G8_9LEPT|nr:TonB-dependent receptor [Leptospira ryugenii]GBF51430.1 TonB-dependent receptor [Leptospira ryugenii]